MSIEISDAVLTAVTDAFIRLSNETPSLEPVDRLDIVQRALKEAWPDLIPAITADLRAQYQPVLDAAEEMGEMLVHLANFQMCDQEDLRQIVRRVNAYAAAFTALAGAEGDDAH